MCGFAGFWTTAGQPRELLIERGNHMCASLRHRGPDDAGMWSDPESGVLLGSRRLAIIDLSVAGHMPMISHCGRYVLAYNGEIYNFRDIRRELENNGHQFVGNSDTEVLVNAWAAWGPERTLKTLNGMFAFAIWDRVDRSVALARDRMGEKPVYYGWHGNTFMFGSELKALRAHPDFSGTLDVRSLALYFRHGYVPAPYTAYEGIRKLPAGHFLILKTPRDQPSPKMYWSAKAVVETGSRNGSTPDFVEARESLHTLLRESVQMRVMADVPVGAFLSGGVDSSLVVALMQATTASKVKTFTIGFDEHSHDEARYAQEIAGYLGTDHTALRVSSEAATDVIPKLADIYDEPFADPSQIPTFLVCRLARQAVTVCLSGDGGDELFGGYREYRLGARRWGLIRRVAPIVRSFPGSAAVLNRFTNRRLRKAAQLLAVRSPEALHLHHVSGWQQPKDLLPHVVEHETAFTNPSCWLDHGPDASRMMYLDMVTYLPEDILTKLDRASMAVSLEARVPLLDHRIVELAWRLPHDFKIREATGKRILRSIVARYLPSGIFNRPKMGFGFPLADWLRGPLRPWAEELLSRSNIRRHGILNADPIVAAWKEHLDKRSDRATELWTILMFQAWRGQWG